MEKISSIVGIDHIGYAVRNLEEAKKHFELLAPVEDKKRLLMDT